jgi:hypothetical protein
LRVKPADITLCLLGIEEAFYDRSSSTQERFKRGAADAGQYFRYMSDFVGFTEQDAQAIREARFIIEKHIPASWPASTPSSCATRPRANSF